MSIIWTLRKFVDPIAHREEEAARERDRRLARRQALGDGRGDEPQLPPPGSTAKQYQCRVCGFRPEQPQYCPHCLADTVVELPSEDPTGSP